jgi:hypothetical protein
MSFVYKYDLERGDMLELKIKAFDMKMTIYKHSGSTAKIYVCPDQTISHHASCSSSLEVQMFF